MEENTKKNLSAIPIISLVFAIISLLFLLIYYMQLQDKTFYQLEVSSQQLNQQFLINIIVIFVLSALGLILGIISKIAKREPKAIATSAIIISIIPILIIIGIIMIPTTTITLKKQGSVDLDKFNEEYRFVENEEFDWYKHIGTIQTFTSEEPPATVKATVYLGYKKDDKATSAEIIENQIEIKEFLRVYFRGKSASELKNVNNEEKFKIEIRNGINDRILSKSKIREIKFEQLDIVEQN